MRDLEQNALVVSGLPTGPKQQRLDLSKLLYVGAASMFQPKVTGAIESGCLGSPRSDRLPLLKSVHSQLQAGVSSKSMSVDTVKQYWRVLKYFIAFADSNDLSLASTDLLEAFLAYGRHIKQNVEINGGTKYAYSQCLASILAPIVGIEAPTLQWKTKIRQPRRLVNSSAKENLRSSSEFIQLLIETVEQLTPEAVRGPLPLVLRYEEGGTHSIYCGAPFKPLSSLVSRGAHHIHRAREARESRECDTSLVGRAQLINLRIEAELLIFISQTSANLSQALQLNGNAFRYQSDGDYLRLIIWKNRAKHPIDLRIHKAYRHRFEAYLAWRNSIFAGEGTNLTFPFVWNDGERCNERTWWPFVSVKKLMAALNRPYVNSRQLRKTVGNYVRRNASRETAASLLSNSVSTFTKFYEEVHHQSAVSELVTFWNDAESTCAAVGPGVCQSPLPAKRSDSPPKAPSPDCEGAAGCLFCDKNRDIRSFDHVWNLASLHHLKLYELNADRSSNGNTFQNPVALAIDRISAKLDAFVSLGGACADWVSEARQRVQEGRYHPFYTSAFELLEGGDD